MNGKLSGTIAFALVCAAAAGFSMPARAAVHGFRGAHAGHIGATYGNGEGGLTHVRGTRISGARGTAGHASRTTYYADGSIAHNGGTNVTGANGGSFTGRNSYTRNADGSSQWTDTASGKNVNGGTYDHDGNWSRASDGSISGSSQTTASGAKGTYDASSSAANGTFTHDTTVTNAAGDIYTGQSTYTKGHQFPSCQRHRATCAGSSH